MMNSRKALLIAALCLVTTGAVYGKLPVQPMSDEQMAKAAEAKAKAGEAAKKEAEQLGKAQDLVAGRFIQQQKAKGVIVKPTPIAAAAPAPATSAPAKK